jgi:hypothetical protein
MSRYLFPRVMRSFFCRAVCVPYSSHVSDSRRASQPTSSSCQTAHRTEPTRLQKNYFKERGQLSLQTGTASACAATTALRRYNGSRRRCWLANTDADCEVPADWLLDQVALARRGFVAVAGIIDVDSFVEHELHVKDSFRRSYRIQSDGWHPHVHGANMGIRADAYLRAHDLWRRLESCGGRRLADATLQVLTSGRREGRAPLGFAAALAAHNGTAA